MDAEWEGCRGIVLPVVSNSAPLTEDVLMVQKAPGRADLGCGGKIDIFPP